MGRRAEWQSGRRYALTAMGDAMSNVATTRRDVPAGDVVHGLPGRAYTDPAVLDAEYARVFAPSWCFVGFAHELGRPGDAVPVTVAGQPLVLVRNAEGRINALHNVCRHRGHTVVGAARRGLSALVCPYHAWTYDLDGRLRATPHFGGYRKPRVDGFDRAAHSLKPVRCGVWHDWVFVNLDGAAPPLEEHVAPLARRLNDLDLASLTPLAKLDLGSVKANWKFLVENFVEPYHVPVVHSHSASGQPLREHYMIDDGACFGCAIDVASESADTGRPVPADALDMSSLYLALFPNFILGHYAPDQLGVHLGLPEAPDRTRQWRVIYHLGDGVPDAAAVEKLAALWRRVHAEDHAVVERLQAGRASPVMDDGGVLSPHWETSVRRFHLLLGEALGDATLE